MNRKNYLKVNRYTIGQIAQRLGLVVEVDNIDNADTRIEIK